MQETHALRTKLAKWASDPEWSLLCRHDLLRDKPPHALGDRWFRRVKTMLAKLRLVRPHVTKYSWLPTLKHAQQHGNPPTLLIWALGVRQEDLRAACEGFIERLEATFGIVPVLVTDVPDFYYFSRLKWLIEYVPELSGVSPSYRERKQHYLAWRYRDALIVPVSAGSASETEWNEVMRMKR